MFKLCCKIWYVMLQNLNVFHRNITSYWKDFHFSESKNNPKKSKNEKKKNKKTQKSKQRIYYQTIFLAMFRVLFFSFCNFFLLLICYCQSWCTYSGYNSVLILATCVSSFRDNIFSSFTNTPTIISTVLSVTSSLISYLLFVC